jgi:hypothetical protein
MGVDPRRLLARMPEEFRHDVQRTPLLDEVTGESVSQVVKASQLRNPCPLRQCDELDAKRVGTPLVWKWGGKVCRK